MPGSFVSTNPGSRAGRGAGTPGRTIWVNVPVVENFARQSPFVLRNAAADDSHAL